MKKLIVLMALVGSANAMADNPTQAEIKGEIGENGYCYFSLEALKELLATKCPEDSKVNSDIGFKIIVREGQCTVKGMAFCEG